MSRRQIQYRVDTDVWERIRPRVYVVRGTPRSWPQTVLSAILAAGDATYASHRTAARLWDLPIERIDRIEVTIPIERRVRIPGVIAHRSGTLHELDVAMVGGVPVTSPARTLADLSSMLTVEQLGRALDDGLRRGIVSLTAMHAVSSRFATISPGRSPKKMAEVLATGSRATTQETAISRLSSGKRSSAPACLSRFASIQSRSTDGNSRSIFPTRHRRSRSRSMGSGHMGRGLRSITIVSARTRWCWLDGGSSASPRRRRTTTSSTPSAAPYLVTESRIA